MRERVAHRAVYRCVRVCAGRQPITHCTVLYLLHACFCSHTRERPPYLQHLWADVADVAKRHHREHYESTHKRRHRRPEIHAVRLAVTTARPHGARTSQWQTHSLVKLIRGFRDPMYEQTNPAITQLGGLKALMDGLNRDT